MRHRRSPEFKKQFYALPAAIKKAARKAFYTFLTDPASVSLKIHKLNPSKKLLPSSKSVAFLDQKYKTIFTICQDEQGDKYFLWYFIGTHADYDKVV